MVGARDQVLEKEGSVLLEHDINFRAKAGSKFVYGEIRINWVLGLLAQSEGKLDQSIAHIEMSLVLNRDATYRPELDVTWPAL